MKSNCQFVYEKLSSCSGAVWEPLRIRQARWYLKNHGLRTVLRKILENIGLVKSIRIDEGRRRRGQQVPFEERLNLTAGEAVRVRNREEIMQTLNKSGEFKGLAFTPEMWDFCDKKYEVYKRVDQIVLEATGEYRKMKNTVLLKDVICDGSRHYNCDRSCFHFWREAWLERI